MKLKDIKPLVENTKKLDKKDAAPNNKESYAKPSRKSLTGMASLRQRGAAAIKPGEPSSEIMTSKSVKKKPAARKYAEEEETVVPEKGEKPVGTKAILNAWRNGFTQTDIKGNITVVNTVEGYIINSDDTVTVTGNAALTERHMEIAFSEGKLPIRFKEVHGLLMIAACNLQTLEGCPASAPGGIDCSGNRLKTLEHAPAFVKGEFDCAGNILTTLEHAPAIVKGDFHCGQDRSKLSLKHIQKYVKEIDGTLFAGSSKHKLDSPLMGIFFIKGLKSVVTGNPKADEIINKYLKGDRDMHLCQEDLIEAGFENLARV